MTGFRWMVSLIDVVAYIYLVCVIADDRSLDGQSLLTLSVVAALVALNITAILARGGRLSSTWLGLYIQRKKAEESVKLKALT